MWWFQSADKVWTEPPFHDHLEADERVVAAARGFTGLLGYPLLNSGPMWGSTLWEIALTSQRILAVQRRFVPWPSRAPRSISISLSEVRDVRIFWDWGTQTNVKITTAHDTYEFKISGFPRETHAFKKEIRGLAARLEATPLKETADN